MSTEHIMKMLEDIAAIKAHTQHLVEMRTEDRERLKTLEARVVDLEITKARAMAWAASFGAIAASLVNILKDKIMHIFTGVAVLAFVSGCASVAVAPEAAPQCYDGPRWHMPAVYVDINSDMSSECKAAVKEALAWWRGQGVGYLVPQEIPYSDVRFDGLVPPGHIAVQEGELSPGVAGETFAQLITEFDMMVAADITIAACDTKVVAHEIGHALGLSLGNHHAEAGNIMCESLDCADFNLNRCQKARVR